MSEFVVEMVEEIVIIKIQLERATLSSTGYFRNELIEHINAERRHFIVDCSKVLFMDSTFLGALVVSLKKANSLDGDLKIVFKSKESPIRAMFEASRMLKIFNTFFSVEEAIASFNEK